MMLAEKRISGPEQMLSEGDADHWTESVPLEKPLYLAAS